MNNFSAVASVRAAWGTFKQRPAIFIGAVLCVLIATWIAGTAAGAFGKEGTGAFFGVIVNFTASTLIGMGEAALFLKADRDAKSVRIADLWHPRPFWKYVGGVLVVALCAGAIAGSAALVVIGLSAYHGPGTGVFAIAGGLCVAVLALAVVIRLQFTQYFIIDKSLWPLQAARESARITRGHFWQLVGLFALLILMNIVGCVVLLVGLLVSLPVSMLAVVHAYRALSA